MRTVLERVTACHTFRSDNKKARPSLENRAASEPAGIQTPTLLIRSQMLYSVKLRVLKIEVQMYKISPNPPRPAVCDAHKISYF